MILGHLNEQLIFHRLIVDLKKSGICMKYSKIGFFYENLLLPIFEILDLIETNTKSVFQEFSALSEVLRRMQLKQIHNFLK